MFIFRGDNHGGRLNVKILGEIIFFKNKKSTLKSKIKVSNTLNFIMNYKNENYIHFWTKWHQNHVPVVNKKDVIDFFVNLLHPLNWGKYPPKSHFKWMKTTCLCFKFRFRFPFSVFRCSTYYVNLIIAVKIAELLFTNQLSNVRVLHRYTGAWSKWRRFFYRNTGARYGKS